MPNELQAFPTSAAANMQVSARRSNTQHGLSPIATCDKHSVRPRLPE